MWTTNTEERDIAPAAMSGLSRPIAAIGMAAMLYPNNKRVGGDPDSTGPLKPRLELTSGTESP